ncbi:OmpW family protein [Algoriphagus lacus]|uniref:OmpW family protein n=1 Tax=Algoriphagus lacus TaxID=2056311 RepID=A0A418PRE5_9BACT|nr:OmpW family outer membrane protein [Algoriphagus lacus]RIW15176.1 OmpW family protein [Algoriphagus lacus]
MKKFLIISAFLVMVLASVANAQSLTTTSYSMGLATGDMGDYTSNFSGRGFTLDYRKMVQPNLGVGFYTGWNVFYDERPYDTYTIDNRTVSGKQYRYVNSFPIMVATDYFIKPGEDFNPYVGLGVGTIYTERATDMGIYRFTQDAWSFAFTPQVGFLYSLSRYAGINFSAKYNLGLAAGDFESTQSYVSFNIGYVFMGN